MAFEGRPVEIGEDIVFGEDLLQHIDALGAGLITTVVPVVVVVISVLVSVHGPVVVPVKSTHGEHLSRDIQRRHQELVAV